MYEELDQAIFRGELNPEGNPKPKREHIWDGDRRCFGQAWW